MPAGMVRENMAAIAEEIIPHFRDRMAAVPVGSAA
jgi:hypothetical protein